MHKKASGVKKILQILKKLYPNPQCALHYQKPFELLVAVILSAQCTDKKVNEVTPALFKKYRTINAYANASPHEFEKYIYSTGFYRAKTKNILGAANYIIKNFKGRLPRTISEMVMIPGVGRKTANVVLGELYGISEGITVDTHVIRLARLLGLTTHKDAVKIELDLMKIIPPSDWIRFAHSLVLYGREYCPATRHNHHKCPLGKFYVK